MIEGLVKSCFREMQVQYGEKFGAALVDLNRRLVALEEAAGTHRGSGGGSTGVSGASPSASGSGSGKAGGGGDALAANNGFRGEPPTPAVNPGGVKQVGGGTFGNVETEAMLKSLVERLERLEKK
jgi:hypothetical protein